MPLKGKNVRVRGRWWHYQIEIDGAHYSGNTRLAGVESNRKAAESAAERERQRLLHPHLIDGPLAIETEADRRRKPFDMAAAAFSTWAREVEYRAKPATAARIKTSLVSCVAFFGDRPVSQLDAAAIEDYKQYRIQEHHVRDITLRHDLHALSVFFRKFAVKRGYAAKNPLGRGADGNREVSIPSDRDAVREHIVSAEEERVYLAAALELHAEFLKSRPKEKQAQLRPNLHDLAVLMLEQGARPEELLAARQEDVSLDGGTLRIAGGKSRAARRVLNLTPRSLEVVRPRMEIEGPWLFPSEHRRGEHVTKLQCTHDRVCRRARVSFVIYDFRHTWATRMIAAAVDVPTVAAILGHSGLRTIFRYVHPTAEAQKLAMERYHAAQMRLQIKVVG